MKFYQMSMFLKNSSKLENQTKHVSMKNFITNCNWAEKKMIKNSNMIKQTKTKVLDVCCFSTI